MTEHTVIYTPPAPVIPHYCPTGMWKDYREDTIVRCECGQYWKRGIPSASNYTPWKRVRWYHFRARHRIKVYEFDYEGKGNG